MARYRKIDTRIWTDLKFNELSPLKPSGQALFFYLLTARESTMLPGLMSISEAGLAERLGWSMRAFRRCWREIEAQKLAKADWKRQLVWLPNAIKYNEPTNPNVVKGWFQHFDELPECGLRDEALCNLYDFILSLSSPFRKAFEKAFEKALAKGLRKQEQEQKQKQKQHQPPFAELGSSSDAPATAESSGGVDGIHFDKGGGGVEPLGRGEHDANPRVDIPSAEAVTRAVDNLEREGAQVAIEPHGEATPGAGIGAAMEPPCSEPSVDEATVRALVVGLGVSIPETPIDAEEDAATADRPHNGCSVVKRKWAVGRDLAGLPGKEPLTRLDIDKALRSRRLISVGQSDLAWRQLSQLHDESPLTAEELIYAMDLATKPNVRGALSYAAGCVRKLRKGEATITQGSKQPEYIHQQADRIKNRWLDLQRTYRYPKDESRALREAERGLPGKDDVERYRRNAGSYERMDAEENTKRVQGLQSILASLGESMSMST